MKNHASLLVTVSVCLLLTVAGQAQGLPQKTLTSISFEQKLDTQISLASTFRDESGRSVQLKEYFDRQPVILVLGYYECPMLCHLVLNGLVEGLQNLKASIGKDFAVICVSIDPTESAALAAAKKRTYLQRYGRSGAATGWHFLTGQEPQIRMLANEVGFQYAFDPQIKQYAHPSGVVVLTPQGRVARYLFGISYAPKDLNTAIAMAKTGQIGEPAPSLLLLCFRSMMLTGKHSGVILGAVRLVSVATLLAVVLLVVRSIRQERKTTHSAPKAKEREHSCPTPGKRQSPADKSVRAAMRPEALSRDRRSP